MLAVTLAATPGGAGVDPGAARSSEDALVARAAGDMQRARESGDPSWYDQAAAAVDEVLQRDPGHYGALRARAWVLLGQHRFPEARRAATRARDVAPDDFWNWANLTDACVELGDYACATGAANRLMALRPGIVAWTRTAALQALCGDRRGAIATLELAARAALAAPRPETSAWILVHLGHEHAALGEIDAATRAYETALATFPGHHLALAGLARARAAAGRLDDAIALAEQAAERTPSIAAYGLLGDLHAARGDTTSAERAWALAVALERLAASRGATHGREAALFLADHDRDVDRAVALARADAGWRDDVDTADILAWALHKAGRHREAMRAAHRALRLGTESARFHHHAGMIALALGRPRPAARHLRRALALEPAFDVRQAPIARAALAGLDDRGVARR